jgi:hypothetical protein
VFSDGLRCETVDFGVAGSKFQSVHVYTVSVCIAGTRTTYVLWQFLAVWEPVFSANYLWVCVQRSKFVTKSFSSNAFLYTAILRFLWRVVIITSNKPGAHITSTLLLLLCIHSNAEFMKRIKKIQGEWNTFNAGFMSLHTRS